MDKKESIRIIHVKKMNPIYCSLYSFYYKLLWFFADKHVSRVCPPSPS